MQSMSLPPGARVPRHTALRRWLGACALVAAALAGFPAAAQLVEERPISLYGTPGVIDTPSARFMPDGTLAITAETKQPDDRITVAFQALPWFEGSARYSIVYGFNGGKGKGSLFDRSLGFKLRLAREGRLWPELAIGVLDLGGTVVFGGEYLVASKKFGPFDTSLGLGFGRLGTRAQFTNPLVFASDGLRKRPLSTTTGTFAFKQLFHGEDVSLFGGVVIDTPVRGLQFLAEYSGDAYAREQMLGIAKVLTPVNIGVSYRPLHALETSLGFLQGHIVSGRITIKSNFENPRPATKLDPPSPEIHVRTDQEMRRGLSDLLAANGAGTAVPAGPAGSAAGWVNAADLENEPDWTIYPIAFAGVAPDLRSPAAVLIERLDAALGALRYRVADSKAEGTALIFDIVASAERAPLSCDELWQNIPLKGLDGFEAVTFRAPGDGQGEVRCTKFLSPASAESSSIAQASGVADASGLTLAAAIPNSPSSAEAWWNDKALTNKLANSVATILDKQGLKMEAVKLEPHEATIYFTNTSYPSAGRALGRAARSMTQVLPPSIEIITLVMTTGTVNGTKLRIPRTAIERAARSDASPEEILTATSTGPAGAGFPKGSFKPDYRFPSLRPIFAPAYRHSLFDPDDPLRYQLYWRAGADIQLFRGLGISGTYAINVTNNFNTITRVSNSTLPHVRSDVAKYLTQGASGVERLALVYMPQFAPALYGRVSIGYLEEMYGGVDAEILYRPFARRLAFGAEIARVKKRNFDRKFGFQNFEATTGHLSAYYESPYYGLDFHVHAGRYLAGDWGATFEIARHFDNGAEVMVFATLTDVPFRTYGEGSFDKGITIKIPLDMISFFSTRQTANVKLNPLTRDGGARLDVEHRLYEETRGISYGDVQRTFGDFLAYH